MIYPLSRPAQGDFVCEFAINCNLLDKTFPQGKVNKNRRRGISAAVLLFHYSSLKPLGFWLCQRQESRHMSARDFSAFQPSSSADLPGSA